MFILKRQDVEITNFQHPKRDQQIPILNYQGQTFRLISAFNGKQAEDARALWRDLTDNRGKACVLLEEPDRYSVWGKVRLDQLAGEEPAGNEATKAPLFAGLSAAPPSCLLRCRRPLRRKASRIVSERYRQGISAGKLPPGRLP